MFASSFSLVFLCSLLHIVGAQFQFFQEHFGHHQQQQQRPSGGASQWAAHSDSIPCSQYLCPATLQCVSRPSDCPCPSPEDVKCTIPATGGAATVICARGQDACNEVNRLAKAI